MKMFEMFFYLVLVVVVALRVNQFLGWAAKKFFTYVWQVVRPREGGLVGRALDSAKALGKGKSSFDE